MFTRVEVRNFRSLRSIDLQLSNFHVLTGPNGTGKTTLLDVFGFLADLMNDGLEAAIEKRTSNYHDLTFGGNGENIFIALEANLPSKIGKNVPRFLRYQLKIGKIPAGSGFGVLSEALIALEYPNTERGVRLWETKEWSEMYDNVLDSNDDLLLIHKLGEDADYWDETGNEKHLSLRIGDDECGLANVPSDESKWPIGNWFLKLISASIRTVMLDSYILRQASPYAKKGIFTPDGARLPWLIEELKVNSPQLYDQWIAHVGTAIPDLKSVKTILREDDRHRYLKLVYDNGIECPSWTASDGTLRLLALTLIAFLEKFEGVYLIEEPENGIHPLAIETIYGALSNMNDAQILLATHSPVVVSLVQAKDLLCFSKTEAGITTVIGGLDHPRLAEWKGELNLSLLFAAGILD